MITTLSEIRTTHVIVRFHVGARDSARLRFTKNLVEKALSGDENAQKSICMRVRKDVNKRGSKIVYLSWNSILMAEFFEDRHELNHIADKEATEVAIEEVRTIFDPSTYATTQPLPDNKISCECVPSSI